MRKELTLQIRKLSGHSEFANRLVDLATQIEKTFQGDEQVRLLELVRETLDHHIQIRDNTRRARAALKQIEADHQTLLKLFEKITIRPSNETLH